MSEYFDLFFVQGVRGASYIPTLCLQVLAVILLMNQLPRTWRGWCLKAVEWLLCCAAFQGISAVCYTLLGGGELLSPVSMALYILLYALLRSKYPLKTRIVRGTMFMACVMVTVPISSPLSDLIKDANPTLYYSWGQYLTLLIIFLLTGFVVWYLRHFSMDADSAIQFQYVVLQASVSLVIVAIELVPAWVEIPRVSNVLTCIGLWGIDLLTYYLFYSIARSTNENMMLHSTKHRMELEQEKYEANRVNFDELRAMRHELKNYTFYCKALLDAKKYDELSDFFAETLESKSSVLTSFDCGNYMVNVIMNHEINAAREHGVRITTNILVPDALPYSSEDLCSLLSNLLDNAIEAASVSGAELPQVSFSMCPKQAYLFIHQENSVSNDIASDARLSLKTTKQRRELHGYGTRIIRSIVDKYNGSIKYTMKNGMFVTDVMLELPKEEEA
ncbi:MAG: GHKL domain-containing protein [Clostridia bacterium]|nr:GHKL domain-containing protein [Clostridia bacterium]